MGERENKAYQEGLERGRAGCTDSKGVVDTLIEAATVIVTCGLVVESDSVKRAREGGFEFGKNNPASGSKD